MDDEALPPQNPDVQIHPFADQPVSVKSSRRRIFRFSPPTQPFSDEATRAENAERLRLEALARYHACGSLRGAAFDDVARLAAFICQTPLSLISLVDSKRQWFLSSTGIEMCETSREVSFCAHALIGPDMMIVPDARADARFADNPCVIAEPFIRFYAGAPLVTPDGYTLGTLCVIDRTPRTLSREQREALVSLSRLTMTQLEMHRLKLALSNSA